ncbi:MAG: PTS system mannose/fructose/sorbose family transporter subunit IID [Desulfovermiculus sp.]
MLNYQDLFRCFWRTYLIGANFNTRGLQNIGLSFAMEPGLRAIHASESALQAARTRYVGLFNTHPYFMPLLVGAFLFLEKNIAQGMIPSTAQNTFQNTATYTLSALGDSVFGGSLLVFWSLCMTLFLVAGWYGAATFWFVLFFLGLQIFKGITFWLGFSQGLAFFQRLRQMNLMYWGYWIKVANAVCILALWSLIYPFPLHPLWFAGLTSAMGGAGWLIYRGMLPREVIVTACLLGWGVWESLKVVD